MRPGVPGDYLVRVTVEYFEFHDIARMKCSLRVIHGDRGLGIPGEVMCAESSYRLDPEVVRRYEVVAVECCDKAWQEFAIPVGLCIEFPVVKGCIADSLDNHVTLVVEHPILVGVPDIRDFEYCRNF